MESNRRFARVLVAVTAGLVALAWPHAAEAQESGWKFSSGVYVPFQDSQYVLYRNFLLHALVIGGAQAAAVSNGAGAAGSGKAWDTTLGGDPSAQVAGTGSYLETWVYLGPGEGLAAVSVAIEATGLVHLQDADCAAAALGFSEFESNLLAEPAAAVLVKSVAETELSQLGQLSLGYEELSASTDISVGLGEGRYPDHNSDVAAGQACVSWVSRRLSSSISQMATDLSGARRENSSLRASGDHGIPPSAPSCDLNSRTGILVSASRWTRPPNGGTRKIPFRPSRLETNAIQRLSGDQRALKSPASLSTSGTASPPAVGTTNMDSDPGV